MKNLKKSLLLILVTVISAMLITACGSETLIDLSNPSRPVLSTRTYYTEEELNTDIGELQAEKAKGKTLLEYLLEENPDLVLTDAVKYGVNYKYSEDSTYIKNTEKDSPNEYIDAATNDEVYMVETHIIDAGKKKVELYNYGSYKTDEGSTEMSLGENCEFYDLIVTLPFKPYYTNGTKTGKKTVLFDNNFVESNERCVAVANKKTYKVKKITVKGVKSGKVYKPGQKITISSKNAIKVFTINDENIAANTYTFNDPGKYTIRIVLANDTEKVLKITVRE